MKLTRSIGGLLAALSISPSAFADTGLPGFTSMADCTADDGSTVGGATSCAVDHSAAAVTTEPFVSLSASAAYSGGAPASSGGLVELTYNFAVIGGTQDTVVPVDIDALLQQVAINADVSTASGFAQILVNTPLSSVSMAICSSGCTDSANSFFGTLQVNVLADELASNTITLEIEARAGGYGGIPANSASAYIDPRIYIDPSFANAGTYSVVLSDGIGNGIAPAVPEPGTLALMLGGLAFAGLGTKVLRRRPRFLAVTRGS